MRLGIEQGTLSKLERGVLPYNQDLLERAALAYGCDPYDILTINPLEPSPPRLIFSRVQKASPEMQRKALELIEVLLKSA